MGPEPKIFHGKKTKKTFKIEKIHVGPSNFIKDHLVELFKWSKDKFKGKVENTSHQWLPAASRCLAGAPLSATDVTDCQNSNVGNSLKHVGNSLYTVAKLLP